MGTILNILEEIYMKEEYFINDKDSFVIKNYQNKPTFSSFLPGIAGKLGIPMWVFYVNRGQAIASFGTKDKDNSIMEFYPANKSYSNVSLNGFRTFIKLDNNVYEPFREINDQVNSKMVISPGKLEITEVNKKNNIKTNIIYHTLANENFAGLIRRVGITNLDHKKREVQVLDGMPRIIPFGIEHNALKNISQTITAWIKVYNLNNKIPFYRLKSSASDQAKVDQIKTGNFFISIDKKSNELLNPVVDPLIVFCNDKSFNKPYGFINNEFNDLSKQINENQFPSAMSFNKKALNENEKICTCSIFGNLNNKDKLDIIKSKILDDNFFDQKIKINENIHNYYSNFSFTKSGNKRFDGYIKQTFLDNILRGGFPVTVGKKNKKPYHIFSRKHGDLERDYNDFSLEPRYFSQGNGNYRDINQNRRSDLFFNPNIKRHNIKTFLNLINLEGFNPLVINGQKFIIKNIKKISDKIYLNDNKLSEIINRPYSIGELYEYLMSNKRRLDINLERIDMIVDIIIDKSNAILKSDFGEGYWIDHWTYNLDLIENYLRIYPDKVEDLFTKKEYKYYDSEIKVLSRKEKYCLTDRGPRQYNALKKDKKKKELIKNRDHEKHYKKLNNQVYKSNLLVKMFIIILNKVSSLDSYGLGIEMEANKPGWYDALNGLPGLFGSSFGETAELLKWTRFTLKIVKKLNLKEIVVLEEVYDFYNRIDRLILNWLENKDNYKYWDQSNRAKEKYREKIFYSLKGNKKGISKDKLIIFYKNIIKKLNYSISNSKNEDGLYNMFYSYHAEDYVSINKSSDQSQTLVEVKSFNKKQLSNFLEGQVKAHKILNSKNKSNKLHQNILKSDLYDNKLKMFRVNGNLNKESFEIGRAKAFSPGWLENGSVWLHMEYKYLLELLKSGLYKTFYETFNNIVIFNQDPKVYKRSIFENSSFILSSLNEDITNHGRGYIARLSGATAEFIDIWTRISFGNNPFDYLDDKLIFKPNPILKTDFFTKKKSKVKIQNSENENKTVILPKNTYSIRFLGNILVVYHNEKMKDTFGKECVKIKKIKLTYNNKKTYLIKSSMVKAQRAHDIRDGLISQMDIILN